MQHVKRFQIKFGALGFGTAFGCGTYYYWNQFHHPSNSITTHSSDSTISSSEAKNIQENEFNFNSNTLHPSFRAMLIQKLLNFQFQELKKSEVLIEIAIISLPILFATFTAYRTFWSSKRSWKRKEFFNVINISLNTITRTATANTSSATNNYRYGLYFRTLLETDIGQIIPNEIGIKELLKAAKTTSNENPFILVAEENAHWTICNKICNQISSLCANAFIHRDICHHSHGTVDAGVRCGKYLMAITCEPERSVKHKKIRVILIQEEMIQQLLEDYNAHVYDECFEYEINGDDEKLESNAYSLHLVSNERWSANLEDNVHKNRWQLIKQIAEVYQMQEKKNDGGIVWGKPLCDLELCTVIQPKEYYDHKILFTDTGQKTYVEAK